MAQIRWRDLSLSTAVAVSVAACLSVPAPAPRGDKCGVPTFAGGGIVCELPGLKNGYTEKCEIKGLEITCDDSQKCKSSLGDEKNCTDTRTKYRWYVEGQSGGPPIEIMGRNDLSIVTVKGIAKGTGTLQLEVTACCGIIVDRDGRFVNECEDCAARKPAFTQAISVID